MPPAEIAFDYSASEALRLELSGDWQISSGIPAAGEVLSQFSIHKDIRRLSFDASALGQWDSGLVSFLFELLRACGHKGIEIDLQGLPEQLRGLLEAASKATEKNIVHTPAPQPFLDRVGEAALRVRDGIWSLLDFLGDIAVGIVQLVSGRSYFRRDEFIYIVQRCGASALPLISLISVLVGVILAFIGAIQLRLFGAQIFIADIVGIAMVRVMGAVMAGILMAGRTGASFAAELGIMEVNEEIDALKTLGISPVEFLVVPRLLALVVMMPLLTLYADFMGILGGFMISAGVLGLNPVEYWHHTQSAVKLSHLWVGLIHGFVFGIIIAVAGCLRGIRCGRSAAAVGEAATGAVVEAITSIVIATAIITFVCQVLGV